MTTERQWVAALLGLALALLLGWNVYRAQVEQRPSLPVTPAATVPGYGVVQPGSVADATMSTPASSATTTSGITP